MKIHINGWRWKNFMSYGEVEQKIDFLPDKGELILLAAKNGSGKSAGLSSLDFSLFGECLNKRGKRRAHKQIPNRVNGNAECSIDLNTDDYHVEIKRQLSGSLKTYLKENDVQNTKAKKLQERIEEIIGYDMETFKSFISINVNIFKDFINLTPEDKRTILDKLFNLEQINMLNKVLKQLSQKNLTDHSSVKRELQLYEKTISDMKSSMEEILKSAKNDNESKLKELKEELNKHKKPLEDLETKKEKYDQKFEEIDREISALRERKADIVRDKKDVQAQIALFDQGKCPTCGTDLSGQLNIKADLSERLEKTEKVLVEVNESISEWNQTLEDGKEKYDKIMEKWDSLIETVTELKSTIKVLSKDDEKIDLEPIKKNIEKTEKLRTDTETTFLDCERLKLVHELLMPIWGEKGIKRDIISEMVPALNEFIREDLETLNTRFTVELDDAFDAHVYEWSNEIDPDTLSEGEGKKVNLIIMLAYLKTSRLKRFVNVLILDEAFASVDIEGIEDILKLLKKYANERGINVIIVHHSELNRAWFDRVIQVHKGAFSHIEDIRL